MTVDRIPEKAGIHGVNLKNHVFQHQMYFITISDSYEWVIYLPNISVWKIQYNLRQGLEKLTKSGINS